MVKFAKRIGITPLKHHKQELNVQFKVFYFVLSVMIFNSKNLNLIALND